MNTSDNANIKINHEIWNLPPAESYSVYIDETNILQNIKDVASSQFVGVVFDSNEHAEDLGVKHGTNENPKTLHDKLKNLLTQPIGILGISFEDSRGNVRWLSSVYRTAEIICNLLLQRNPLCKKISFFVEECSQVEALRSPQKPGSNATNFNPINPKENQRALNQQAEIFRGTYAELLKKRAPKIAPDSVLEISFEIISKKLCSTPQSQKIRLVYADVIANIWGGETKENLRDSPEWKGLATCFFDKKSTLLLERTILKEYGEITPADWSNCLLSLEHSYENFLLSKLSEHIRKHPQQWNDYMEFTSEYLNSKAIRMELLEKQVKWLSDNKPNGVELPKTLQFMLLRAQIAECNHKGKVLPKDLECEFNEAAKILKRENVRLVAETRLHIATSYTNVFRFKDAKSCLQKLKTIPSIALGLQLQGRIYSALGQCEAFLGNLKEAIKLFDEAIRLFKSLSDTESATGDIDQTLSYKVIARMDSCSGKLNDRNRLQAEIAEYLGCTYDTLPKIARCLATHRNKELMAKEKYHHHVLLRYLASGHAPENILTAYKSACKQWNHGEDFHPWELIEFYRAVLFDDLKRFDRAEKICNENGITLKVIKLAIIGVSDPDRFKVRIAQDAGLMSALQKILPGPASAAISKWHTLKNPNPSKEERLKFFSSALPFNFR